MYACSMREKGQHIEIMTMGRFGKRILSHVFTKLLYIDIGSWPVCFKIVDVKDW